MQQSIGPGVKILLEGCQKEFKGMSYFGVLQLLRVCIQIMLIVAHNILVTVFFFPFVVQTFADILMHEEVACQEKPGLITRDVAGDWISLFGEQKSGAP